MSVESNGNRQRLTDHDRRIADLERTVGNIRELLVDFRVRFEVFATRFEAAELDRREERDERKIHREDVQNRLPSSERQFLDMPLRQAATVLGALLAAILAALLQLFGVEIGGG